MAIETENKDLETRAEAFSKQVLFNLTDDVSANALRTGNEAKRNSQKQE